MKRAPTVVDDENTTTIEECGCTFQVQGNGCHKIRDFSELPGFENDTRQVFLWMNETCSDNAGTSGASAMMAIRLLGLTSVFAVVCAHFSY